MNEIFSFSSLLFPICFVFLACTMQKNIHQIGPLTGHSKITPFKTYFVCTIDFIVLIFIYWFTWNISRQCCHSQRTWFRGNVISLPPRACAGNELIIRKRIHARVSSLSSIDYYDRIWWWIEFVRAAVRVRCAVSIHLPPAKKQKKNEKQKLRKCALTIDWKLSK